MNDTENLNPFDISFKINSYIVSILTIAGVILNSISLIVFAYAKGKQPQIGGINYLGILTLFSIIFLVFHWYINTLPYFANLNDKINLIESNVYVCKLINYLRNVSRAVFALSTLSYSLERVLAIFIPFYVIEHKNRVSAFLIVFIFIVSFTSPIHFALKYDLIFDNYTNSSKSCMPQNIAHFETLTFYFNLFTIYLPIFFVILLNFSIILKLRNYRVEITSDSPYNLNNDLIKMINKLYEENFFINKTRRYLNTDLVTSATGRNLKVFTTNLFKSINTANTSEINAINRLKRSRQKLTINQKFSNTKTLVLVSTVFIFLNIPNLVNLISIFNPYLRYTLEEKIKWNTDHKLVTYLLVSDIINVTNYSINGVLFFMFGKVFRIHLFNIWNKVLKKKLSIQA